jgi:glycosyltransferase involved in cell wall biosynthesis
MNQVDKFKISVVTPTLGRPAEVQGLLENLSEQSLLPHEVIVVDGASPKVTATEEIVRLKAAPLPFQCRYIRHACGTAIQRNAGIEKAAGNFIAFVDDDIRLESDFFEEILKVYMADEKCEVGGIAGYITNQHLDPNTSPRWRWYKRLHLFTTYEPGRYDYNTGYPINRYLQPPHNGVKEIDFMGAGCAVWRKEVFEDGLRFSDFFTDFGVLEDAHLALRASQNWKLLECGRARCLHLKSKISRESKRKIAFKSAVNYRYVFTDIVPNRTLSQELRFWQIQFVDLFRIIAFAVRSGGEDNWLSVVGKMQGIFKACRI